MSGAESVGPEHVVGYNAALFRANALFASILAATRPVNNPGLTISVHALDAGRAGGQVYRSAYRASEVSWLPVARLFGSRPLSMYEDIDIAGSGWRLMAEAPPVFVAGNHAGSLLVLLLGLASTLLAAGYLRGLNRRTLELAHANALLNRDIAERH